MRRVETLAFLLLPAALPAQTTLLELQPGTRVRVTARALFGGRYDATVGARRGDTLALVRSGSPSVDVPISAITGAELFHGKDRFAGMRRELIWGTAIGVSVGALLALGSNEDLCTYNPCAPNEEISDAEIFGVMTFLGVLYGGGIGFWIGRQRWDRLQLPNQRASLLLDRRAAATRIGVRLPF